MTRYLLAAGLALLVAVPHRADGPAPKDKPKDEKPIVVPFDLIKTKHITVPIKVNGKGPYKVIFDTGAPTLLLNNKLAKEAGLKAGGGLFGGRPVEVKELEVGGAKVAKVPAIVMDHPLLELMSKEKDIGQLYGIVGFPFFARYKVTLDYKAKTMTLVPNGFQPPDVMQALQEEVAKMFDKPAAKVLAPAAQWGFVAHKAKGDDDDGVTVEDVLAGGAADKGGLKAGDRLLTLDGRWTDSVADLYEAAGHVKPGTEAKVVVKRDNKEVTLTVKPAPGL